VTILLRIISGLIGGVFGTILAVILCLCTGSKIHVYSMSGFLWSLVSGFVIGFTVGAFFYKFTLKVFALFGRFGPQ
jgi:hypothetical protein